MQRQRHRQRHGSDQHLGDHWGRWPQWVADRPRLLWYLAFEHRPELTTWVRSLDRRLSAVEGVDPVPTRWLHLTVADVGFLDEVSPAQLDHLADAARRALDGWQCEPLTFGPPTTMGDALVLRASPAARLRELAHRLRRATGGVVGARSPLVGEVAPHVSIAYSRAAGHRPGLSASLAGAGSLDRRVAVPEVTLAAVTRRPPGYRWRSAATVPVGDRVTAGRGSR